MSDVTQPDRSSGHSRAGRSAGDLLRRPAPSGLLAGASLPRPPRVVRLLVALRPMVPDLTPGAPQARPSCPRPSRPPPRQPCRGALGKHSTSCPWWWLYSVSLSTPAPTLVLVSAPSLPGWPQRAGSVPRRPVPAGRRRSAAGGRTARRALALLHPIGVAPPAYEVVVGHPLGGVRMPRLGSLTWSRSDPVAPPRRPAWRAESTRRPCRWQALSAGMP